MELCSTNCVAIPRAALAKHRERSSAAAPASKSDSTTLATASQPDQLETQQMDLSPVARVFYGQGPPQAKEPCFDTDTEKLLRAKTRRLDSFAVGAKGDNAGGADAILLS